MAGKFEKIGGGGRYRTQGKEKGKQNTVKGSSSEKRGRKGQDSRKIRN